MPDQLPREFLAETKLNRSAHAVTRGAPLSVYLGYCETDDRPVRTVVQGSGLADQRNIPCPDCGNLCPAERLYAVTTDVECDGSCHSARRNFCSCGCGGINHGKSWGYRLSESEETASALARWRDARDKAEAKREARRAAEAKREVAAFAEWAKDNAALVSALTSLSDAEAYEAPAALYDFVTYVKQSKMLTDGQVRYAEILIRQRAEKIARDNDRAEREANKKPVPTGLQTIRGKIIKAELRENDWGNSVYKMTVACDGFAVWSTVPASVMRVIDAEYYAQPRDHAKTTLALLTGREIEFTAQISPGDRDPSFGFASRPKNATLIGAK